MQSGHLTRGAWKLGPYDNRLKMTIALIVGRWDMRVAELRGLGC